MKKRGEIISLNGETAKVRIQRDSACGNCHKCDEGKAKEIVALNRVGGVVGDTVEIEMESSTVLGAAALVYIIPLFLFIIAYFAVEAVFKTEWSGIVGGFVVMVIAYVAIAAFNKKNKEKFNLTIEKVITE